MSGTIPPHIEPARLVDRRITLKGVVKVSSLERFSAVLQAATGEVQVELYFSRDEQRIATMHGHYQVDAPLLCQRCLEQVVVPIDSECDVTPAHRTGSTG